MWLTLLFMAMYRKKRFESIVFCHVKLQCCHWKWDIPLLSIEPHFVSAYEVGRFTYLFLRENAVEQDCGKTIFSRVARVCQNDIGGRFLLEDTWTTFMKARLNCSRSGDVPFYYHELQSTFYLPEQDLIYGVFTTNVWVDSSSFTEIAIHKRWTQSHSRNFFSSAQALWWNIITSCHH